MERLVFMTAHALATAIRQRQVSAVEVLDAYLAQIARHNPALKAIVTLDEAGARQRAQAADAALAQGKLWGPLHGVPLTLKDVHDTAGLRSTMGHVALAARLAAEDSPVVARLKAAGAVLVGKTNAEMFAKNPFGQTRNPWDLTRSPGISSSGAAAALAAGLTPLEIGSDSGGSIIEPAHYTGIYGMRPTERRVPLGTFPTDPVPLWRLVQVIGPLARSVADLRLALSLIAGPTPGDTEVPPVAWQDGPALTLGDLRIAWTPTFPSATIAPAISLAIETFAQELQKRGAHVKQCLPALDFTQQAQWFVRLAGLVEGAFATPPSLLGDYFTALYQRDQFIARWEAFFQEWDVFLCPAAEDTAPALAATGDPAGDVAPHQLSCATGQPAIVIPLAQDRHALPIGVQLIGRRWADERLLAIAQLLSEVTAGFQPPPGY